MNDRDPTRLATYEDVIADEEAATEHPDRVQYTLRSGLPEDGVGVELTATFFESVIEANDVPAGSTVVYAIPTVDGERGLANRESVLEGSPVGEALIRSYPESLCGSTAALGEGLGAVGDVFVTVNLGSTNPEASAYRRGEQLVPFTTGAVTHEDLPVGARSTDRTHRRNGVYPRHRRRVRGAVEGGAPARRRPGPTTLLPARISSET